MRFRIFMLVVVLVPAAFAQTSITLEEALELVHQRNLQLRLQALQQKSAGLDQAISRAQRLPSVQVQTQVQLTDEVARFDLPVQVTQGRLVQIELGGHERVEAAIVVKQPLFTGFRLQTQAEIAEVVVAGEAVELERLRQVLRGQVYQLFFTWQRLSLEQRVQAASKRRLESQLALLRNLYGSGQALAVDTMRVFNQTLLVDLQQAELEKRKRLVALQLTRLLDLQRPRPLAERQVPATPGRILSLDSLKALALQQRPEVQRLQLEIRRATLQQKLARAAFYPIIQAEAGYVYSKPGLNQVANEWMDFFRAGISLQWNLWRGGQDRYRVEQAEVVQNQLSLRRRDVVQGILYEVEKSWEEVGFAARQIELAERIRLQQYDRYRVVSEQAALGQVTTSEVIAAESDLTQAELQVQNARIDYELARVELLFAVGSLVP